MMKKLMELVEGIEKRCTASNHRNHSVRLDRFMWEADDLKIVTPKKNPNNSVENRRKTMKVKELIQLQIKGNPEDIKAAKLAINVALNTLNPDNRPGFTWNWDELGYTDSVGGHHDAGAGWMPDGHYCGKCSQSTCEVCSIWKGKQARQELGGIPAHRLKQVSGRLVS